MNQEWLKIKALTEVEGFFIRIYNSTSKLKVIGPSLTK